MTILRLKNPTNIYRCEKKLEGERGYLALENIRIKSKFSRSNISIREVGRSGERKNPRGRRKKRKKARAARLGAGLKHHLGARIFGAKLDTKIFGAKIYGTRLASTSPTWPRPRR